MSSSLARGEQGRRAFYWLVSGRPLAAMPHKGGRLLIVLLLSSKDDMVAQLGRQMAVLCTRGRGRGRAGGGCVWCIEGGGGKGRWGGGGGGDGGQYANRLWCDDRYLWEIGFGGSDAEHEASRAGYGQYCWLYWYTVLSLDHPSSHPDPTAGRSSERWAGGGQSFFTFNSVDVG